MEAHLATLSRKRGERFLRLMAEKLAEEQNLSEVIAIRPSSQQQAVRRSRRQAAELFERLLPILLARLPEE